MSARTHDTFPVRFPNIFVDYPLGQMRVFNTLWKKLEQSSIKIMANTVKLCGVLCFVCLRG